MKQGRERPPDSPGAGRGAWLRARTAILGILLGGVVAACSADHPTELDTQTHELGVTLPNPSATPNPPSAPGNPPAATPPASGTERTVWVVMRQRANLTSAAKVSGWAARGRAVTEQLQQHARSSQASLRGWLQQNKVSHRAFWGVNTIKVTASNSVIGEISARADVERVVDDFTMQLPEPEPGVARSVDAIEWNIAEVRASEAWAEFGTRGDGIVVGSIDTGAQYDHPALLNTYRGLQTDGSVVHDYNWHDPSSVCGFPSREPCDNAGHGTHTMGTIVGDDGGDNQIGVAPGARWITAKGCEDLWCSFEALLSAGEWMLAPTDLNGQNPRPDLRPQVVSNSWGGGGGDDFYMAIVDAWVAAGIFPVFSNGNSGSSCGSSGSPGDYPASYSAGAYDQFGEIAYFSSRGESAYGVVKPNLSAPGVDVRSSVPGNGYEWYSGTSMAAPHIAGAVALMWSAAPAIWGDIAATREILDGSASDVSDLSCGGSDENNNVWGEGKLDVYEALALSPIGPTGYVAGSVLDEGGGPIAAAAIVTTGAGNRKTASSADGQYSLRLPVGEYVVTASAFGYLTQSISGINVVEDETVHQDFSLGVAPTFTLEGNVTDTAGQSVVGATVTLLGTPLAPVTTDDGGHFSFGEVPQGVYPLSVRSGGCYAPATNEVVLDQPVDVSVALESVVDAYGYQCHPVEFDYIEADTPVSLSGDYGLVSVALPFDFTFYGQTYSSVRVDTAGYLAFLANYPNPWNTSLPDPYEPNAAIYGLWDWLYVDGDSQVLTAVRGEAPARTFVVEWRNVAFVEDFSQRVSFEIVLGENGEIVMQYLSAETPMAKGASATVGIENELGNVALSYSFNRQEIRSELAVMYEVPFSGFVQGSVTDQNDLGPVVGARVSATELSTGETRSGSTNANGNYRLQLTQGTYELTVTKNNYETQTAIVSVTEDSTTSEHFVLMTARGVISPPTVQLVVPKDGARTRTLTLTNDGSLPMSFEVRESGGRKQAVNVTAQRKRAANIDALARDTRSLYTNAPPASSTITPLAPGDVLDSFPLQGVSFGWGIGQADKLWVSDIDVRRNNEFELDGAPTGINHAANWSGDWPGDMAYEPLSGNMCQVAVGGDNGIHCWDPATGDEVASMTGSWSWISQRGLAYNPDDDTFFIGGWNEGTIYRVQGFASAAPGEVVSSCRPADGDISGLAYNPAMGVLWVATNSDRDTIYELNPDDCTVLSTLAPPQGGGYQGAGLEMDLEGNLWALAQYPNTVYLVESGVPAFGDVSWLSTEPAQGSLEVGDSVELEVTIDTAGLEPGLYLASLFVVTNAGRQPTLRIPVSLVVSGYVQGVNAGGSNVTDGSGDLWQAAKKHTNGSWGFMQKGKTRSTKQEITGASDPQLYQTQHQDPYAYRFDSVPNGVYEVDLRFAELTNVKMGKRLFDVIVEQELVLPAHDIVYEVGRYAADDYKFFIPVTDGRMDIRLVPRAGSQAPVINALRVIHRPDR